MRIAITDANIFIDLHFLEVLDYLFVLDLDIHTTHEVIDELDDDQVEYLEKKQDDGKLVIHIMSPDELDELDKLEVSKGLSSTDKSVYLYAQKVESMILTGDMTLRKNIEGTGREVHGIVWIFDQWVAKEVMPPQEAASLLQALVEYNTWLPMAECVQRIDHWQNN